MKWRLCLLALVVLFSQHKLFGMEETHPDDYNKKIHQVILDLDSIITHSPKKDKTVHDHFTFVYNKIKGGDLVVHYKDNLEYDFFGCASFIVTKDNKQDVELVFGNYVIDNYENYPFLVYAIVMHTFQYAFDYYNNQSLFMIGTENQIEGVYFRLDAITMEAMFLKAYASNNNKLGPFEQFIMDDLDNGLPSSSALFLKTDIGLLHKMDALKVKGGTSKALLGEFKNMGEALIQAFKLDNKREWEKYCAIITLRTYVYYSRQVIFDIVCAKDGIAKDAFDFDRYTDNRSTINELIKIIELNKEQYGVQDKVLKAYGDWYRKKKTPAVRQ